VLINAVDDKSSQVVRARSSYKRSEVVWGARFKEMYRHTRDGRMSIDLKRIHDIQEIDTPVVSSQTVWDIKVLFIGCHKRGEVKQPPQFFVID
jgi:hypothetical protein